MASGNFLFGLLPADSIPTTTAFATLDTVSDGSTVVGQYLVLDYAGATADEHAEWEVVVPSHYAGGGLTFVIVYAMDGSVGAAVQFELRAIKTVDGDTLTSENLQAATLTDITDTPGSTNVVNYTASGSITHANAGSPAAGDLLRIRISRDFDHASNADDAQFIAAYVTET